MQSRQPLDSHSAVGVLAANTRHRLQCFSRGMLCRSLYCGSLNPHYTRLIMRFRGPFHLFNSVGVWVGFCEGSNLFNADAIWCGWFPWEGSHDAVKPDGAYLGTVVGARFYHYERKQALRVRKLIVYPAIPALPPRPSPASRRNLFDGATDVDLKRVSTMTPRTICSPAAWKASA